MTSVAVLRRAVWVLGAVQCVYWGVLYYAFAVLLVPMRDELQTTDARIAAAFSLGLGVNAALAAGVGRLLDRGRGAELMRGGAIAAAALLWLWSEVTSLAALYAVWAALGATMALVLYESAFALVTRLFRDSQERLRALASITVLGGLASTVFLPLTGTAVIELGWRPALKVLAVIWLLAIWLMEHSALPVLREPGSVDPPASARDLPEAPATIFPIAAPFVLATLAAMALTTVLIPMLVARGVGVDAAALVLAGLGITQLPGRLWLWLGGRGAAPRTLLLAPLLLQAGALVILATGRTLLVDFVGVAVFGLGAGLHTLARPWVVPQLFGIAQAGRINGVIARAQGVARAAGPVAAAAAYGRFGGAAVFSLLALMLLASCGLAHATARRVANLSPST